MWEAEPHDDPKQGVLLASLRKQLGYADELNRWTDEQFRIHYPVVRNPLYELTDDLPTGVIRALIVNDEINPTESKWLLQTLAALTTAGKVKFLEQLIAAIGTQYDFLISQVVVPERIQTVMDWYKRASQSTLE
jgi:hypothetical protein